MTKRGYFEDDDTRARRSRDTERSVPEESVEDGDKTPLEVLIQTIRDGKPDAQQKAMERFHSDLKILKLRVDATIGVKDDDGQLGHAISRVASLEDARRWLWGAIGTLAVIAASSIGLALSAAHDAGARDGRTETRIEQLERAIDKIDDHIQSIWSRINIGGNRP